ncbi:hypothetical protein GUITHDRAFT_105075 [Guillardia theta CCMP2712]|uniref:Uncharacterized protein n=1 Tax=Guillardia theta (strain CCMP2712) TaxID=905079 RepID=L1JLJ6_GUITC|nr:hypothetical protein GUITHDRAFT_105075 [Guillardia theta CCMP2712]EKX48990.1 hypothetical protein GUITHDRAFT_105075 [Guillardia theta CCMP2712]|eukprot:XP_005835970.1 hypothetical protein GUITHDRAFT_105075 [Guillardia theta CCMP2712]
MNKKRLSTEDKIHIVSLFYGSSRDRATRVSQSHIAKMYGKSRAAISKILRAEQADPNRIEAGFMFDQCENYLFEEYEKVTKTETNGVLRGDRKRQKAVRSET